MCFENCYEDQMGPSNDVFHCTVTFVEGVIFCSMYIFLLKALTFVKIIYFYFIFFRFVIFIIFIFFILLFLFFLFFSILFLLFFFHFFIFIY